MKKSKTILKITSIAILILSICCVLVALGSLFFGVTTATSFTEENSISISQQTIEVLKFHLMYLQQLIIPVILWV